MQLYRCTVDAIDVCSIFGGCLIVQTSASVIIWSPEHSPSVLIECQKFQLPMLQLSLHHSPREIF